MTKKQLQLTINKLNNQIEDLKQENRGLRLKNYDLTEKYNV